jgi:hypothetical protein
MEYEIREYGGATEIVEADSLKEALEIAKEWAAI